MPPGQAVRFPDRSRATIRFPLAVSQWNDFVPTHWAGAAQRAADSASGEDGEAHLAPIFRFYEKKRGHRRTGSEPVGWAAEAVFSAAVLLLGCIGTVVLLATLAVPEWEVNHKFAATTGVVLDKRTGTRPVGPDTLFRPEVQMEYQVDGRVFRVWTYDIHVMDGRGYTADESEVTAALEQFEVGQPYRVFFDPDEPGRAVVIRGTSWWLWVSLLVPVSFMVIGAFGLTYRLVVWGKSAERRSARARKGSPAGPPADSDAPLPIPGIPPAIAMTDSPGTHLAFRLPASDSGAWSAAATMVACVGWNVIVGGLALVALQGHLRNRPDWILTFFLVPFLLAGLFWLAGLVRWLVVTGAVGPTLVEISAQPVIPGQCYRLLVSQSGRLKVNRLAVVLECHERAVFRQGTDTRTETRCVFRQPLFQREGFEIQGGAPFEATCPLLIPAAAMHSFKSDHNEICWKIIVEAKGAASCEFRRSFPFIVHPGQNGQCARQARPT